MGRGWSRGGGRFLVPVIARGFCRPIRPDIRDHLLAVKHLADDYGEIINAAADDDLTRQLLEHELRLGGPGYALSWQQAVDRIASDALRLYVSRLQRPSTSCPEREHAWLACFASKLDPKMLPDAELSRVRADCTLPAVFRVGLYLIGDPAELPSDVVPLVREAFEVFVRTNTPVRSPDVELLMRALWRSPDSAASWHSLLDSIDGVEVQPIAPHLHQIWGFTAQDAWWRLVLYSAVHHRGSDAAGLIADEIRGLDDQGARRLFAELAQVAARGDGDLVALVPALDHCLLSDARAWLQLASRIRSSEPMATGLSRLKSRILDDDSMDSLALEISFLMTFDAKFTDLGSGMSAEARRLHPAASVAAELLTHWASCARSEERRLAMFAHAAQAAPGRLAVQLRAKLQPVLTGTEEMPSRLDNAVADSITALSETPHRLRDDELAALARRSKHNVAHRAHGLLAQDGTPDALDQLLGLHNDAPPPQRPYILPHLQRLSVRLGVRVERDSTGQLRLVR